MKKIFWTDFIDDHLKYCFAPLSGPKYTKRQSAWMIFLNLMLS